MDLAEPINILITPFLIIWPYWLKEREYYSLFSFPDPIHRMSSSLQHY